MVHHPTLYQTFLILQICGGPNNGQFLETECSKSPDKVGDMEVFERLQQVHVNRNRTSLKFFGSKSFYLIPLITWSFFVEPNVFDKWSLGLIRSE